MRSFSPFSPRSSRPRIGEAGILVLLSLYIHLCVNIEPSRAFSFSFSDKPTQCGSDQVTVDGGTPPYRIVMVPAGPLANGPEIRTIVDQQFNSSSYTLPPLNFPGGSNFTAVMSDSTGTGTGGTSLITDVADSSNTSCLATSPTSPLFFLELPQDATLTQCGSIQVTFSGTQQGQATLMGLIPGGESFSVDVPSGASSVNWSPIRLPAGTGVMLVAGDDRGRGTGGSTYVMIVQGGSSGCLNDGQEVYSSTNSPYAGGQYATGSGGGTVTGPWNNGSGSGGGSNKSSSKVGMIVGIVIGVLALLAIIIFAFFYRRRKARRAQRYGGTKEVDLLNPDRPSPVAAADQRSQGLVPVPYYSAADQYQNQHQHHNENQSNSGNGSSGHRPSTSLGTDAHSIASHDPLFPPSAWNNQHQNMNGNGHRPHTPSTTGYEGGTDITSNTGDRPMSPYSPGSRPNSAGTGAGATGIGRQDTKGPEAFGRRPVNVVQHNDAGAVPTADVITPPEAEVVELPPSYNEVRRHQGSPHTSP